MAKKCVNLKGSIKFNKTCLNNGFHPKIVHRYNVYSFISCHFKRSFSNRKYSFGNIISIQ